MQCCNPSGHAVHRGAGEEIASRPRCVSNDDATALNHFRRVVSDGGMHQRRRDGLLRKLIVATWNIRSLLDSTHPGRRSALVSKELHRYNISIAALSEIRLAGAGERREQSHTFFLVRSLVIAAYAPTLPSPEEANDEFYESLSGLLRSVPDKDKILLLGDFNARVGCNHEVWSPAIGRFGRGNCNTNVERLLALCTKFQLAITNTFFNLPNHHYNYWQHPRSKRWHLLDYIITRRVHLSDVCITRAMRGAEFSTDHILIRSKIRLHLRTQNSRTAPRPKPGLDVGKLHSPEVLTELNSAIGVSIAHPVLSLLISTGLNSPMPFLSQLRESLALAKEKTETGLMRMMLTLKLCCLQSELRS